MYLYNIVVRMVVFGPLLSSISGSRTLVKLDIWWIWRFGI